jgi:hypothetical protein
MSTVSWGETRVYNFYFVETRVSLSKYNFYDQNNNLYHSNHFIIKHEYRILIRSPRIPSMPVAWPIAT